MATEDPEASTDAAAERTPPTGGAAAGGERSMGGGQRVGGGAQAAGKPRFPLASLSARGGGFAASLTGSGGSGSKRGESLLATVLGGSKSVARIPGRV